MESLKNKDNPSKKQKIKFSYVHILIGSFLLIISISLIRVINSNKISRKFNSKLAEQKKVSSKKQQIEFKKNETSIFDSPLEKQIFERSGMSPYKNKILKIDYNSYIKNKLIKEKFDSYINNSLTTSENGNYNLEISSFEKNLDNDLTKKENKVTIILQISIFDHNTKNKQSEISIEVSIK